MKIEVKRFEYGTNWTIGRMYIDEFYVCYTLEGTHREIPGVPVEQWKVPGKTAIPIGTYPVTCTFSNHFQRDLPLLGEVSGYEGVRIHPGNTDRDTEGCILVGTTWAGTDFIGQSKVAFDHVYEMITEALKRKELITLEVSSAS